MQKIDKLTDVYAFIKNEAKKRDSLKELSLQRPDPLFIASNYKDEFISLICALFAYGNANSIVKFLSTLDFSLLDKTDDCIYEALSKHYYRFQNANDVTEFFITLSRVKKQNSLENIFKEGYNKKHSIIDGLQILISSLYDVNSYRSRGYEFLLGKIPHEKSNSTYKRWNMYLRWMVRKDNLDMGLWSGVSTKDLLLPLDTHTFKVGQKLGLITRKSYDFKAVLQITEALKKIDKNDPIKYDFALYRIGQEKIL